MQIDKILVLLGSAAGIGLIYWFFLLKNDGITEVENEVDIKVEGGYTPETISVAAGKTIKINFLRTDANSCLEEVVLPDFKIKKFLPLNEKVSVNIKPEKTGVYDITCGMNMFHGKIIAK